METFTTEDTEDREVFTDVYLRKRLAESPDVK
jgi:hypothetical protein